MSATSQQTSRQRPETDREASELARLIARLQSKLTYLCRSYDIEPEDAEDILQQVLLAFVAKRSQIMAAEPWLMGALKRECLMHLRTRQRRLYEAIDETLLDAIARPSPPRQEDDQLIRDLDDAISNTPDRCQPLLRMRYRMGLDNSELAKEFGYRKSSVRKIASRCLAALTRQVVVGSSRRLSALAQRGHRTLKRT